MSSSVARPLAGLATVVVLVVIVVVAIGMFRGDFGQTVPVTVVSERAGLVMNPQAKVKMRGVQVGQVESIETRPDGKAVLHLAMNPDDLQDIPSNAAVDITSSTVFGAKFVQFAEPPNPSTTPLAEGAQVNVEHVTVETNTVFQQLTSLLRTIEPVKLNQTLAALSGALSGRGEKLGQAVTDFDHLLATVNPSLDNINRDLEVAPVALGAYADAAPSLVDVLDNAVKVSGTLVDQEKNLDTFLISATGLANVGNEVFSQNLKGFTDVLHMLVPTTNLLNEYSDGIRCGIQGLLPFIKGSPLPQPGIAVSSTFTLGVERYRYPHDLPKVAATGGPHCKDQMLPLVPVGKFPPFLVADVGANPWEYGNQGILANSDALKEALFGPLDGPPRNSAQIGQPG